MASTQQSRPSRKMDIPDNYILNWQAEPRGAKKLVRRPMTACKACRIAKVKCSGQSECDRCSSRGIPCRYTTTPTNAGKSKAPPKSTPQQQNSSDDDGSSPITPQPTEEPPFGFELDTAEYFGAGMHAYPAQGDVASMGHMKGMANQQMESFDWTALGFNQNASSDPWSENMLGPSELDYIHGVWNSDPLSAGQMMQDDSHSQSSSYMSTMSTPPDMMFHGMQPSENCHCRSDLMLQVPQIKVELHEQPSPRLDRIFKVTENVIRSCHTIISCKNCQISYTDLVCITAVFQQTDRCFDYIAKADVVSPIKVSVGEYEICTVDDIKLRRMLVMDLVKQANALLDSLSSMAQHLFLLQPAGYRLGQINLVYLQEVVNNFRNILQSITATVEENLNPNSFAHLRPIQ